MAKFGDYTPPPDEAEVIEVGFAKQEVVDSTKEEGKKVNPNSVNKKCGVAIVTINKYIDLLK